MPLTVYIFLLLELLVVTYGDLKYKKIPNYWSLVNIIFFIILHFIWPKSYPFAYQTFFYSAVFILVGFFLFTLKIMGGGDSKYLATSYLLIPSQLQESSLKILLSATILVGGGLLFLNTYKNRNKIKKILESQKFNRLKEVYGKKFPYAPVILLMWMIMPFYIKDWHL